MPMRFISRMAAFLMRFMGNDRPGFGLTLGITLTMLSVLILIPLASVLIQGLMMEPAAFWKAVTAEPVKNAFLTSLGCSLTAAIVNSIFGLILAWTLVRCDFPGKSFLDGVIELPLALPTAVAGITLSKMYANTGFPGKYFSAMGIDVAYTHLGIMVAMVFVGIPFVVRTIQPVLQKLDPQYEEAACVLGAGRVYTFFRVILPELMPALLTGFGLAFARGVGEYGSVIYISGNSARAHTQVVSYVIMQKLNYMDYRSATAIALLLLVLSFLILLGINAVQIRQSRRTSGGEISYRGDREEAGKRGRNATDLFWIMASGLFVAVMLLLPLFFVLVQCLSRGWSFYISALTTENVLSALYVSLLATGMALLVNTVFGIAAGILLTKYDFPGKNILATLIDIPFSVSPVIAGLSFIMIFGRTGWAAPWLNALNDATGWDVKIVFALPGVILATIFVTFPFVCREIVPVLNAAGRDEEEAASLMGAGLFTIFRRITFPQMKWALLYGMILCAARALGEFGAVNALSKTRGETFTLPLEVDALYLSGAADSITAAFAVSSILVLAALFLLILRCVAERRVKL